MLTTPVVDALASQGYQVHYLVKSAFAELLEHNPYVHKVWALTDSLTDLLDPLKSEAFDVIIDLHNNLRSGRVKSALKVKSYTFKKDRLRLLMLTKLGINRVKEKHIVYRFMDVLKPLGIAEGEPAPTTYIPDTIAQQWLYPLPSHYLAIAVGAAWKTKQIPTETILEVIKQTQYNEVVLVGGPDDKKIALEIEQGTSSAVLNLTGKLSITESAHVIQQASAVLAGDTGMMHIAASLGTPCVAIYGSTHPVLGYTPFYGKHKPVFHLVQNENLNCRPCTKQGEHQCPRGHFKCMLDLDHKEIVDKIDSFV